jgi:hypothetical protein
MSGMGSKNFDHLYAAIKLECGSENGYRGIKLKDKKAKKDLWIVSIVNNMILGEISILEADSILKKKNIKPFIRPNNKPGYEAEHMIINGDYIKFSIISARIKGTNSKIIGATLRSTYELYCNPNPLFTIPSVNIDIDFFKKKVMKKISCRYQVFNNLALGAASYMWDELHFIF